jgi:hypothetical protein
VRIFKTKWLVRYARRQRIDDASLKEAIERADRGLIDADLGGGIIKQRVARAGQGRSGGRRMLVANRGEQPRRVPLRVRKNERDNIDPDELLTLREIGAAWLAVDAQHIAQAIERGILQEVVNEDQGT